MWRGRRGIVDVETLGSLATGYQVMLIFRPSALSCYRQVGYQFLRPLVCLWTMAGSRPSFNSQARPARVNVHIRPTARFLA
jgi:hypothetical protein